MVETFATSQYKEKFFGNLTLSQSAVVLFMVAPGVLLAFRGFPRYVIVPYALVCLSVYAGLAFWNLDEHARLWLGFASAKRRILWGTDEMADFIGVRDIRCDCVFTADNRVLSVVKVMPRDLASLSENDVERVLAGYGTFLNELSTNIQIIMSSTEIDMEGYLTRLRSRVLEGGNAKRLEYFEHFSRFMRDVIAAKTVTDRDYYIVVTQPITSQGARDTGELDTKTNNLMSSLKDAGIECERVGTEGLRRFYANYYNPKFKLSEDDWTPVTFHWDAERQYAAERSLVEFQKTKKGGYLDYQRRPHCFERGGRELFRAQDRSESITDELMPSSIDIYKDYAQVEKLHRVLFTVRFPATVHPGWLTKLVRQSIDFDVVFHIHPLSQKTSIDYLQHEITKLETDVTTKEREGLIVAERDKVNLQKVKELLNRVSRDEEKCFDVALYVNVKAYTLRELDTAVMRVRDVIEGMNAQVRVANWEMSDALKSCFPLAQDRLGERRDRMFPSSAVRDSYPFILSSLEDKGDGSVIVGYNQLNGIPVLMDIFRQPNPHILVLGSSGSGKSFMVKKLFLAHALQDVDTYIIDPQGEYGQVVKQMGGTVIRLACDSGSVINLFDMSQDTYDGRKTSIKAFFNIIRGRLGESLSGTAEGIVDRMIDNAYRKSGIYLDDKASWRRTPPTFTAIFEALSQFASENTSKADSWKKTTAEALLSQITPLVSGDMRYLNQQTTVSLEGKNIVCFDVSSTPAYNPIQRALSLFVVFDFIHSRVCRQNDKRRRMIIVDEAWSVFENNQDYLGPIVRTGRKDNISVVMIDQNVEDLLTMDAQGRPRDR